MNRPRQQGTAWETAVVRAAAARPHLRAQRAPNNAPGRDVELRLLDGTVLGVECKDRANLNVHKLLADIDGLLVAWARKSRKGDNVRRTADGPAVLAMPLDVGLALLEVVSAAFGHVHGGGTLTDLHDAVIALAEEYLAPTK